MILRCSRSPAIWCSATGSGSSRTRWRPPPIDRKDQSSYRVLTPKRTNSKAKQCALPCASQRTIRASREIRTLAGRLGQYRRPVRRRIRTGGKRLRSAIYQSHPVESVTDANLPIPLARIAWRPAITLCGMLTLTKDFPSRGKYTKYLELLN